MKIKTSISDYKTLKKPSKEAIFKIDADVAKKSAELTLEQLKNHVVTGGHFSCSYINTPIFNNELNALIITQEEFDNIKKGKISENIKSRSLENLKENEIGKPIIRRREVCWTSQQLFGLDIDNGKMPLQSKNAIERAKKIGSPPCFLYHTFTSHEINKKTNKKNPEKYRMIFQVKKPITDFRAAKVINLALMILFPECDPATKDLNRVFYGTSKKKKSIINETNFLDIEKLFIALHDFYKNKDTKNYSRNITKFCNENGLAMFNNLPAVTASEEIIAQFNKTEEYLYRWNGITFVFDVTELQAKYKNFKVREVIDNTGKQVTKIQTNSEFVIHEHFDFDLLEKKCELAKVFANGVEEIAHQDLMRLISALIHVKGGQQYFLNNLARGANSFEYTKMENEMKKTVAYKHNPWRCENNVDACPYFASCKNSGKNILDKVILKRGQIKKIDFDKEAMNISKAEIELKNIMLEFSRGE